MEKPLYAMKPSIINAVVPNAARNILISAIIALPGASLWFLVRKSLPWTFGQAFALVFIAFAVVLNLKELWNAVCIWNTTYYFYRNHLVHEFELFKEERISILYEKINNVKSNLSLWDRMCNAGDLEIFLKDSHPPVFTLLYVKYPAEIESKLHQLIRQRGSGK